MLIRARCIARLDRLARQKDTVETLQGSANGFWKLAGPHLTAP